MNQTITNKILFKLKGISHKKYEIDKKPHNLGTEFLMYNSEMYLIEILGENEGFCMTKIAELMGITKGAVSQTFKKLDNKGLVTKFPDPVNASRALLYLTKAGKRVLKKHTQWHEEMDGGFAEYLDGLSSSEAFIIIEFLNRYEYSLDKRLD